jgi:selT/selW/selH-like putative selenoprotein
MDVRILYCAPCGYRKQAVDLAEELRHRFGSHVEVAAGKLGHFDVFVDGVRVKPRPTTWFGRLFRRPPTVSAVVAAVERHRSPRDADHCELPAARGESR